MNLYHLRGIANEYSERYESDGVFTSTECLNKKQFSFLLEHWKKKTGGNPQYGYDGVYFDGNHKTIQSAWEANPPFDD